jgi:hypothetical protein
MLYAVDAAELDEVLLDVARRLEPVVDDLATAERQLRAFTVDDVAAVGYADRPVALGPITRRLWGLVYTLFVSRGVMRHPSGFHAKSVLLARVHEAFGGDSGVAFLAVRAAGAPVLVPLPHVPDVLLSPGPDARFAQSAEALREVANALVKQVNLVVPAALALAQVQIDT